MNDTDTQESKYAEKIINRQQAIDLMNKNYCVFVSGAFDLMHIGHLEFLKQAKQVAKENQGLLVVAVISDEDIVERKGKQRPVYSLDERSTFLTYVEAADYILPWVEPWENLRQFVQDAKPKILAITEGDPATENKKMEIEKAGGKLVVIPKVGDYSTTSLIEKIKTL